ncbi:hypothetical protein [Algoriphagus mannitolivorans]|uniref:hypothetical protein n=1 Tax=Algoriphagus mannitolivorans TaxID=226504 RepID=UPI0004257D63|nr:hypothetical protein [Algoriphagus mannitolivorans]
MAKSNETFDQIFKEKLEGHQEKPSALAWERLESQLPKSKKPGAGFWWAIAASLSALLMVAYVNWPTEPVIVEGSLVASTENFQEALATSEEAILEKEKSTSESISDKSQPENPIETQKNQTPIQSKAKTPSPSLATAQKETKVESFVAEASSKPMEKQAEPVRVLETRPTESSLSLPELKTTDISKAVAEVQSSPSDEPLYRVSIFSNGIKKSEPMEKNLITELGKTVGHVEGLLGKVDEGFAGIQDKKDNLFASLTSKRERADEKP